MKRSSIALVALLLVLPSAALFAGDDGQSDAEARGKHIYTEGESTSGRVITAAIQMSEAPAPASVLPCTQCHGADGGGIGIVAPAVTWEKLTESSEHEHLQRVHGPFDEISVARAIRDGIDPAGNELEATMPRYRMADADMSDLIAYLKHIGSERDPGLSSTAIRIGTVLPADGPLAGIGNAMRAIIEASFADVNEKGGIHGRQLELVVGEYGGDDTPSFWHAQDLVSGEPLFALLASYLPEFEGDLSTLVKDRQIPHIGPYNLLTNDEGGRYEFFVRPSIVEQTHALAKSASAAGANRRIAIVYPLIKDFDTLAVSTRGVAEGAGLEIVFEAPYALGAFDAASFAERLQKDEVQSVVFLGSAREFLEFARAADRLSWRPDLLAPAQFSERAVLDLPKTFDKRVFLAYPALPEDRTEQGMASFEALHRIHDIDYDHSVAQIAAFSAVRVLVTALEAAGTNLSRDAMIEALEGLRNYAPGLTPAVSFGADRRVGALGAHVLRVDLYSERLDGERRWVSLAP